MVLLILLFRILQNEIWLFCLVLTLATSIIRGLRSCDYEHDHDTILDFNSIKDFDKFLSY